MYVDIIQFNLYPFSTILPKLYMEVLQALRIYPVCKWIYSRVPYSFSIFTLYVFITSLCVHRSSNDCHHDMHACLVSFYCFLEIIFGELIK